MIENAARILLGFLAFYPPWRDRGFGGRLVGKKWVSKFGEFCTDCEVPLVKYSQISGYFTQLGLRPMLARPGHRHLPSRHLRLLKRPHYPFWGRSLPRDVLSGFDDMQN